MARPYTRGLHDLGNGLWAYLQPDGSWGWSNAGLVVDGDRSLLVDTLFDLKLTREMLDAMRRAVPAAQSIDTLVNTHANGDHCFGNQLVGGARIVASSAAAREMAEVGPARLAQLMSQAEEMGEVGAYLRRIFGAFDFDGITLALPNETFDGETSLTVGEKQVRLYEVGPAHTRGDLLVHLPAERAVFAGDILFVEGHPVIWAGPIGNWLRACDRILAMDVESIVPGHGPLTDQAGVRRLRAYLDYIAREARRRYDAGMPAFEAAQDIALDDYSSWGDAERIVVNVHSLYREFSGDQSPPDVPALFAQMAVLANTRRH
ncbi:MAG TPA: MBL fold metallo-hydrolase [Thermoanaerobaculia bacterium]|nr:MBL fold metallo-hydrolase [Thermoanaerobaculia bacterium]